MLQPGIIVRGILARFNYSLTHVEPELPPTLNSCLHFFRRQISSSLQVICFDNEVRVQSELLEVFPVGLVSFWSPIFQSDCQTPALGSVLPPAPTGRFLAVVDIEAFPLDLLLAQIPWLPQAEALLLRVRLGSCWAGELDVCRLAPRIEALGFHLTDVLSSIGISAPQAPADSAILLCDRRTKNLSGTPGKRHRIIEALTYLSAPIVQRQDFRLLAGRGSFGFGGGIFNPGAIVAQDRTYLLARAEQVSWAFQKRDESLFFVSVRPWLMALDADNNLTSADGLVIEGLSSHARVEDFRLFQFHGQVFSNHVVIMKPNGGPGVHQPVRLERMQTRIGISQLNLQEKRLTWCGHPTLDRPLTQTEKNWAMFTDGHRLFLLYSFSPYILLAAQNWPGLKFATIVNSRLDLPFEGDGLTLRNSINPVDYDDDHWLHIVHKVYPGKQYSFWAVLLSKQTLQPVRVSARPLVRGWHSASASIIYACSVIVGSAEILLFAGLDDSATAVATISRERLDAEWVVLAAREAQPV